MDVRPIDRMLWRWIPRILWIAAFVTLLVIFRQWAYVTTYRLYLDRRVDDSKLSSATQRFDLEAGRVVPQIVLRDDRVVFRSAVGRDATVRAELRPAGKADYEIRLRRQGADDWTVSGEVTTPTPVVYPFPSGTGEIEIVTHGQLTWSDLRLQRNLNVTPELWVLAGLLACAYVYGRVAPRFPPHRSSAWLKPVTVVVSVLMSVGLMEAALRAVGSRLSPGISTLRRDLGEPTGDPRWQQSPRYGQRLQANVRAINQWRYGDIVRMGFIPPDVIGGVVYRFPMRTDSEGFRNEAPRDDIEVAALGDSFTDALTLPIESAWTSRLERAIGRPVQNYGTAGFGPAQELMVLEEYAIRHHPRVVVLAFFAGNDIRDAEAFDQMQNAERKADAPLLGWPIKDVVSRADTWYLTSAIQAAVEAIHVASAEKPTEQGSPAAADSAPALTGAASPDFDRGMFSIPISGRPPLRWALMPPYLNLLRFTERDLAARRGWTLALQSINEMRRVSRAAGAEFVLMFMPFKSQVYWPLMARTFSRDQLARAFQFYLDRTVTPADVERMSDNRLAQNRLMQRFCEDAGIPFLDLSEPLRVRVDAGENTYFPDDSHLNETGAAVVAETLASFLRQRGLIDR